MHTCIPVQTLHMEEAEGASKEATEGASAIHIVKAVVVVGGSRMGSPETLRACSNHPRDALEQEGE